MTSSHVDVYQTITNQIVKAIEHGAGTFHFPWHRSSQSILRPINVASQKPYRGINILCLWTVSCASDYSSGLWGTFKQWRAQGASVRKGEKATHVVLYKEIEHFSSLKEEPETRLLARATPVFSAEQVDGFELPGKSQCSAVFHNCEKAEAFISTLNAVIHHGHDEAFYRPASDSIHLPDRHRFVGTPTSSSEESYYATLFHELTHWTGAPHRCNRDLTGRFGSDAYSMEELIAELGAAFLCAEFGVSNAPRQDHAQYISHWLSVLKSDKRAIFSAASKASQAVDFLTSKTLS